MVERLFLTVPRGCLQFVIVVFPDHTHLLFLKFQTGVLAGQMHINSLNLRLKLNLGLKILNLGLKQKVHINSSNQCLKFQTGVSTSEMQINSLNPSLKISNPSLKINQSKPSNWMIGFYWFCK